MSPTAQRVALARYLGWRHEAMQDYDAFYKPSGNYAGGATHDLERAIGNAGLPDYGNDLNAIHEAEKAIPSECWDKYMNALAEAVLGRNLARFNKLRNELIFVVIKATAAQRLEAMLRTLGLWVDELEEKK